MINKEEILRFVKAKGPIIPNQIKKEFGGETYLISAVLSELSADGLVKISHTKIGNSPTYYAPGQEYKLENLKKFLNQKDQRTLDLLKQKKVLRDKSQEMLTRVGLRNIKDFAKPVEVNVRGEKEIFWKWHLVPKNEVEILIRKEFASMQKKIEPDREVKKEEPPVQKEEKIVERQEVLKEEKEVKKIDKEGFAKQIYDYFEEKSIEVEEEISKKRSEIELKIIIPSNVGKMEYYCKAKSKKKCNDGDLSSAYIKGQSMKLPVLFITIGDLTKKAKEMLNTDFKGMVVRQI